MKTIAKASFGLTAISLTGSATAATLLEFDNQGGNGTGMPQTYGDNVSASDPANGIITTTGVQGFIGTPDIAVEYTSGLPNLNSLDSYPNWDGRGPVLQTDYGSANPLVLTFTPRAGFGALIRSFDLDEFAGGEDSTVNWAITNGTSTAVIASGTWNDFNDASGNNGGRSTITTGMTTAQAVANADNPLTLSLELTGGESSYQALDNLSFDQVNAIPEAGTATLCLAGLGAGAMRRRRRR